MWKFSFACWGLAVLIALVWFYCAGKQNKEYDEQNKKAFEEFLHQSENKQNGDDNDAR